MFGRVVNFFLWAIRLPRIFPSSPTESSKGLTEPEDEGEAVAPQSNQDVSVGFFVSLACFLVFQTVFTVFVKITGDVYGSDFAFFDTQLMNIVYAGLCLPFFFVSLALRATCVMQRTPTWLHGLRLREYPGGAREWFMEQGWIMVTSVVDAFASFLYGIGGNGSTGTFQSLVSNFGPFFLQLVVYVAYSRQRKTRKALWQQDSRWRYSSVISLLGLMGSLFLTVYTPSSTSYPNGGVGYTCSIVSFLLAAVCTTISWHVKEHLYVTYNTDAIYLNTCNALHMVWLTFPLFLLQTRVPQSWTSCTASGTIGHNFEDGWKCMRRTLRDSTGDGFADGCSSAGWSEWIYAISTWLAGMGQFAFTRYAKSSAFQFLFTIATAALSTCFFWVAPSSWLHGGIHVAALPYNVFGLVVCLLLTMVFSACERDVMEEQATTEGTRLNVSDAQGNHAALLNA